MEREQKRLSHRYSGLRRRPEIDQPPPVLSRTQRWDEGTNPSNSRRALLNCTELPLCWQLFLSGYILWLETPQSFKQMSSVNASEVQCKERVKYPLGQSVGSISGAKERVRLETGNGSYSG